MGYAPARIDSTWRNPPGDGDRVSHAATIAVVALVIAGSFAPVFAAGTADARPSGFVGVPDTNVNADLPGGVDVGVNVSDLRGSTMATDHASTLDVTLTTTDRAADYLDNSSAVVGADSGDLALVLSDEVNHEGREVALPLSAVKGALGHVPDLVHGVHDDGTEWTRPVQEESGLLVFEVPHFSDNAVSFESRVSVAAIPATDGSQLSWDVNDLDAASDVTVNMTGVNNTEWDNVSKTGVSGSIDMGTVGGTAKPRGVGGGEPEIKITGKGRRYDYTGAGGSVTSNGQWEELYDVNVAVRERSDSQGTGDGNTITADYEIRRVSDGTVLKSGSISVTDKESFSDSNEKLVTVDQSWTGDSKIEIALTSKTSTLEVYYGSYQTGPAGATVSAGGSTYDFGKIAQGTTEQQGLDLSAGDSITVDALGSIDTELRLEEVTESVNPGVEINGKSASFSGRLADGQETSITLDKSALQEGVNTLNVSVGDGTLSSDAPTPKVSIVAEHDAVSNQTVGYQGDAWSERYNVSKTWADSRESASLTIPFATNVMSIREVEFRTDSSSWTSTSNYELDGTTLTVNLGSVDAGETTRVRVNGSRVRTHNGSITVTDPTVAGNSLESVFRIDSRSDGFYIGVGGTDLGSFVHYLVSESWTSPSDSVVVESDGTQRIYVPDAPEGATASARTIPVEVQPENDARVSVVNPSEPSFKVEPAGTTGDPVDIVYHDTVSGETYGLVSESRDEYVIDKATAESPVTLTDPEDDTEVLAIRKLSTSGSSGGGGGAGGGGGGVAPDAVQSGGPLSSPLVVGPLGVAMVLAAFLIARRTAVPMWAAGGASVLAFVVVIETLSPGTVSGVVSELGTEVASGIGQVSSALILGGGLLGLWALYRLIKRFTRRDQVALRVQRGE